MFNHIFKNTVTIDEKRFYELCDEIEAELRKKIKEEYRDKMKAIDFNSYKVKVELSNLERKYIELQEAYDILQSKYMGLQSQTNKKNTMKDRSSTLAAEIFGNDV